MLFESQLGGCQVLNLFAKFFSLQLKIVIVDLVFILKQFHTVLEFLPLRLLLL